MLLRHLVARAFLLLKIACKFLKRYNKKNIENNMMIEILIIIIAFILAVAVLFIFIKNSKFEDNLKKREEEAKNKMYEIYILNAVGEKIGYSLDIKSVIEIIIGSLKDFIDYTSVSYMLIFPEKIIFRSYIDKSVSHKFINDVKLKMLDSVSIDKKIKIEETFWGANLNDEINFQVDSFFNIPLVISGKTVGLLTVADKRVNFYKESQISALNKISQRATQALAKLQGVVEQENSKLNAMVASMTDGVVMIDKDNRVIVSNPVARKAVGLEQKNDLSLADIATSLNGKIDLKDKIEESVRLDKIFVSDEISFSSGFFRIVISSVKDRWQTLGSVIIFRDITREKEVAKIKEDFTSMIVHELRSPLDSIKKMTELMRVSEVKKEKRAECYQMIYGSSSDMLELINNLLDIAKIEAGKFELMKQNSDIKKLIASRILFFDIAAKDAKVKLTSCFSKDVPDIIEFDPHTISQVLNNLLSNAIKFTKENGNISVQALLHKKGESVETEAKNAGITWFIKNNMPNINDSLLVAVTDNGIGIPADQITKLFNKFAQAKNVFVEKGGTGLGLAIIKSIVDSHGGTVGAESIAGQGSTFYFTLPIKIEEINKN